MVKIGLVSWKQGGGTNDYVKPAKQPWLKGVKIVQKGQYKGLIPFEKALQAALLYKYDDVEVNFINKFDEKLLEKNDVNFLVSLNLLAAWEKSDAEYKRVEKLMQKPSLNFYPNLKEQFFLFDKGDYLEYYQKKGIPIAPTFVVRDDRNPEKILAKVRKEGWKSFVLKPHRAYANIGIGKFDVNDGAEKEVSKFLTKNKKFPAFVCQEVMNGFAKFWEIKSFWINGEFKYYVAMKAADKVFSESKIYGSNPAEFGKVSPKVLKDIKQMGKKIVDMFPKMNPHSQPPLYLRIDFGCCRDNTMDGESYFLNEVEYAGCAIFTMEGVGKNIFDTWVKAYYGKAKEFVKGNKTKVSKKTKHLKRVKRAKTRRQNRYKTRSYRGGAGPEEEIAKVREQIKKVLREIHAVNKQINKHITNAEQYVRQKKKQMAKSEIQKRRIQETKLEALEQQLIIVKDLYAVLWRAQRAAAPPAAEPSPGAAAADPRAAPEPGAAAPPSTQPDPGEAASQPGSQPAATNDSQRTAARISKMEEMVQIFKDANQLGQVAQLEAQIAALKSRQNVKSNAPGFLAMMKKGPTGAFKKRKRTKKKNKNKKKGKSKNKSK